MEYSSAQNRLNVLLTALIMSPRFQVLDWALLSHPSSKQLTVSICMSEVFAETNSTAKQITKQPINNVVLKPQERPVIVPVCRTPWPLKLMSCRHTLLSVMSLLSISALCTQTNNWDQTESKSFSQAGPFCERRLIFISLQN